ncbi:IS3 family transposase [Streptomyces hirsutus]|uniref:IS3 family transposase n=1 Tax=Streptomyces hirsutus TaxID=35620 RepID=UPI0034484A20
MGGKPVLRELHISSSAYYRWCRAEKEPCHRKRQDAELIEKVRQVHADSGGIYGSPRVHAVLKREGVAIGRKRVERLMREAGLVGTAHAARAGASPAVTRTPALSRTWCSATSPRASRTSCGSPTSR